MEEMQIVLPLFEDMFEIDVFTGKCITMGQAMRREHLEILGQDNLRFIHDDFERDTRIRLEKKLAEEE